MAITEKRDAFKPFKYQWAYDYWEKQQNAHWLHTEIQMGPDVKDWETNLSEIEKHTIGNILKGFAQTETHVGNYWSSMVPKWFPVPEIKMMAQTFGAFETIHAIAYSYLNDTLGLDDFEAFLHDDATMAKLDRLIEPEDDSLQDIATSLAVFSAAAEGIQLYSSFAVLLSFRKKNLLKGISQQMIFSVRDESLHSEAGCKLFRTLREENPDLVNKNVDYIISHAIYKSVCAEMDYIDMIFEKGDLPTISKEALQNFINDRARRKIQELEIQSHVSYQVDEDLLKDMEWFYHYTSGEIQTDFFANRETGYSKPREDWNDDLFE